jgi:hypothetical protein
MATIVEPCCAIGDRVEIPFEVAFEGGKPDRIETGDTMLRNLTRSKVIQVWFAAVALVVVAGIALGASMTIGTGVMLLALCFVPPVIVLMLWPSAQPPTAAEVLRGNDQRD